MKQRAIVLFAPIAFAFLFSCTSAPHSAPPPFEEIAKQTGLDFWQSSGASGDYRLPEIMGSGAALIDYDHDGDLDVYVVQGTPEDSGKQLVPPPQGWKPGNRLFRNNLVPSGKLSFTDVTETAGVGYRGTGMGVAAGDYDNDGFIDLYVTNFGRNVLYRNKGNGTFQDVTNSAGVQSSGWSTSAAFVDYDKDGFLDLVVVHYVDFDTRSCFTPTGRRDYCGPKPFQRTVTQVFHNQGNGKFQDVTSAVGLNAARGPGLGILTGDFDSNGWPDFIVANDGAANHLWLNQNGRTFQESGLTSGVAYAADGHARAGMGLASGDINGNGQQAVVVTNLPTEGFTFFQKQRGGDFMDSTVQMGIFHASTPYTGFGIGLIDVENRGVLDMFTANGAVAAIVSQPNDPYPYRERNMLLRNPGSGKQFEDITASAGTALEPVEVSRAAVFGDVDNDGGIDILVTNNNGPVRLLRNVAPDRGHWITLALQGVRSNRSGYGSVVELIRKNGSAVTQWVRGDGSYLAANDSRVHFGLGKSADVDRVQVRWPAGHCEAWSGVAPDKITTLREGTGQECAASPAKGKE